LQDLRNKQVNNAALLIVNHKTGDILSWVNSNSKSLSAIKTADYDGVLNKRQPGSTLKPFIYAIALMRGDITAATLINDKPTAEAVGTGLHSYRNYSGKYYGKISMRQALGNSLNIPAIKIAQMIGKKTILDTLHNLGFASLDKTSEQYGYGIALGNGEVSLYELVQAYGILARTGKYQPLKIIKNNKSIKKHKQVISAESSSIVANILSDSKARALEFGAGSLLSYPVQTAIKTGTSTGYRDAWILGFNHNFVAGIWMGNHNNKPMINITGSSGPAITMRAIFKELNRYTPTKPLYLSPNLIKKNVCQKTGLLSDNRCIDYEEWFIKGKFPTTTANKIVNNDYYITQPTNNLIMATDPRVPQNLQAFNFKLNQYNDNIKSIQWILNDILSGITTNNNTHQWQLKKGKYKLYAKIFFKNKKNLKTKTVSFIIK